LQELRKTRWIWKSSTGHLPNLNAEAADVLEYQAVEEIWGEDLNAEMNIP